jgi:hypothetical protein
VSGFATYYKAMERLDDWAADNSLEALREIPDLLTEYRLDACALAEPAAALIHAYDLLTPERRAYCEAAARQVGLKRYIPDRLAPERRMALGMARRLPAADQEGEP